MSTLNDPKGKRSMGRALCLLFGLTAIGLAVNEAALTWQGMSSNLNLILYFLGASMGGKVAHKVVESLPKAQEAGE